MQKQITRLIIIAGPQSSGKTTALNLIKKKFPNLTIINETNQYSLVSKKHLGGAFVTKEIEQKILDTDIKVVAKINRSLPVVVIETAIFHMVYGEYYCNKQLAKKYYSKYIHCHKNLHPIIIFINTKPEISWKRRKPIYLKRIKDNEIIIPSVKKTVLNKYRKIIYNLYPLWLKYYKIIPFEKYMIRNSNKSYFKFKKELLDLVHRLTV